MEDHVLRLCQIQLKQGLKPEVLSLNQSFFDKTRWPEGETLTLDEGPLKIQRAPFLGGRRAFLPILPRNLQTDVLHLHGLDPLIYRAFSFIPARTRLLTTHGGFFHTPEFRWFKNLVFALHTPRFLQKMDQILACSNQDFARFAPLAPQKTRLLPNGIDWDILKPGETSKIPLGCVAVLGSHHTHKGLPRLLEAFQKAKERFKGLELKILGLNLPKNCTDGVQMLSLSRSDYVATLKQASFVLSASEYEGFGIGVAEAMAAGCIPLLSRIPAHEAFLGEESSGRYIQFEKAEHLGEVLEGLLSQPQLIQTLSKTASSSMKRFSWNRISEEILELMQELVIRKNSYV